MIIMAKEMNEEVNVQDILPYHLPNGMEVDLRQDNVELWYTDKNGDEKGFRVSLDVSEYIGRGNEECIVLEVPEHEGQNGIESETVWSRTLTDKESVEDSLGIIEEALQNELRNNKEWENLEIFIGDKQAGTANREEMMSNINLPNQLMFKTPYQLYGKNGLDVDLIETESIKYVYKDENQQEQTFSISLDKDNGIVSIGYPETDKDSDVSSYSVQRFIGNLNEEEMQEVLHSLSEQFENAMKENKEWGIVEIYFNDEYRGEAWRSGLLKETVELDMFVDVQSSLPFHLPNGETTDLRCDKLEFRYLNENNEIESVKIGLESDGTLSDLGVSLNGRNEKETSELLRLFEDFVAEKLSEGGEFFSAYVNGEYSGTMEKSDIFPDEHNQPKQVGMEM